MEQLIVDADLDSLGRPDYFTTSNNLRKELTHSGVVYTDIEWYEGQLTFLESHVYFTDVARSIRDEGKRRNYEAVHEILDQILKQ